MSKISLGLVVPIPTLASLRYNVLYSVVPFLVPNLSVGPAVPSLGVVRSISPPLLLMPAAVFPTLINSIPPTPPPVVVLIKSIFALDACETSKFTLERQASAAAPHLNSLSVAPFKVIPPPSAVVFVGLATDPSSIFLSSTVTVVELTVVVVPLTVRSPPIVTSFAVVTLPSPSTLNLMSVDPPPPICTIAFEEEIYVCTRIPLAPAPGAATSR